MFLSDYGLRISRLLSKALPRHNVSHLKCDTLKAYANLPIISFIAKLTMLDFRDFGFYLMCQLQCLQKGNQTPKFSQLKNMKFGERKKLIRKMLHSGENVLTVLKLKGSCGSVVG
jgi:hypothetical protein